MATKHVKMSKVLSAIHVHEHDHVLLICNGVQSGEHVLSLRATELKTWRYITIRD
jgi:hypothetical protein